MQTEEMIGYMIFAVLMFIFLVGSDGGREARLDRVDRDIDGRMEKWRKGGGEG